MNAADYWDIFMDTGAPEAYLLYSRALKTEARDVPNDSGTGAAGHRLQ